MARPAVTAIDVQGRQFVDDVGAGDLWYFPGGTPHSIQGLGDDGCEFLLVFDSGQFDEDSTFLISDWFRWVPAAVLAKNFGVPASNFGRLPDPETLYMFKADQPGPLADDRMPSAAQVPGAGTFTHRMLAQDPLRTRSGTVRITDSAVFKASSAIAAALVEVAPGGMRELHWHPNTNEWQYYIEGQGRMGVFAGDGAARTFDFMAGDVGYVPFAMGHYIENTGTGPLRFLEMFRSDRYADFFAQPVDGADAEAVASVAPAPRHAGDGCIEGREVAGRAGVEGRAGPPGAPCPACGTGARRWAERGGLCRRLCRRPGWHDLVPAMLLQRPVARQPPQDDVEHRGQEQPERRHADHAGEHRHAHRVPHLGARAGGQHQRQHAHDEGHGRHQDRAQAQAAGLDRGGKRGAPGELQLAGELHD